MSQPPVTPYPWMEPYGDDEWCGHCEWFGEMCAACGVDIPESGEYVQPVAAARTGRSAEGSNQQPGVSPAEEGSNGGPYR